MAPPQSDLRKVGREAFDMLDTYFGRRRSTAAPPPPPNGYCRYNTPPKKEVTLDSTQVAQEFGGLLFMSRPKIYRANHGRFS